MATLNLTIPGRPIVKKNSQIIVGKKRKFLVASTAYRKWEDAAVIELMRQYARLSPIEGWVRVRAYFFLPTAMMPDLSNLLEAPADALEKAKVIANDKQIVSWDGSRRFIDRKNPRVELMVVETDEFDGHTHPALLEHAEVVGS